MHNTTDKSPAELLFKRNLRGTLPELKSVDADLEVHDYDAEKKGNTNCRQMIIAKQNTQV